MLASNHYPPISASQIDGIIGMHQQAQPYDPILQIRKLKAEVK
jgi:hypothetical protein